MMPILQFTFLLFGIVTAAQATSPPFPSHVIFQEPDSLFLENLAVRATSELLITSAASPTLFTLNPTIPNPTLSPLHTFPNATALTGITEYRPGVFALAASIVNLTTIRWVPGSIVIWSLDFTVPSPSPEVRALGRLPINALCANGLTTLPGHPDTLLIADCVGGAVWQMDAHTGQSRVVVQDAAMLPGVSALGINGLHVRDAYLYFTNSQQDIFARVALRVAMNGGKTVVSAAGPVKTLASITGPTGTGPDDFALDREGRAWVTAHPGKIALLSPPVGGQRNWTQVTVVGNDGGTDGGLTHPTSAAFGRGSLVQEKTLYVTSSVGQLVAVDTGA
ncbi:hypothetical protein B0H19DRAFT_1226773 [Mycena capillaripes]|nr:hypothetical protein B0H19DRAFT_1226773 [Mycena capillaripes]